MTDTPRFGEMKPRPQYGEYASPQEQATAMGKSLPLIAPAVAPHAGSATAATHADGATAGAGAGAGATRDRSSGLAANDPAAAKRAPGAPRRWDFFLTSGLLAFAAWNVASQIFQAADLSSVLRQFYSSEGIGTYVPTALAATLGTTLNIATILLFAATVIVTARLLRRGKIAFYVPLIGGAITGIIAIIFVAVLLAGDPAFISYLATKR